jgi:acyl-CoA synthetase (AMP-forming)/AMP-acid ligase II
MTETTSQMTTLSPREWPDGLDTVGRPLPFIHVEVRGANGRASGPGEEGEIFVRGPTVAEAYFDVPRLNETAFDRRWFRTGDFGAWDERGRLRLLDRRLDRIVVSGENVSPAEVEGILLQHPAVADACVVAIGAGARGQEVAAALVLRPGAGLTLEELREFGGRSLAPFKLPRRIHITDTLPRNEAGKFLRGEVRSRFAEEMAEKDRA